MKILLALLLFALPAQAQQTLHAKRGTIWVSFEEDGHQWMVGALKEYASAADDPGFVQTQFSNGYVVKVQTHTDTILHHNCCTTNIVVGTNFIGTIQVGTNYFTIKQLTNWVASTEAWNKFALESIEKYRTNRATGRMLSPR